MKKILLLSVSLLPLMAAAPAMAEDDNAAIEEITIVGSRVKGRTAIDSNVPVDVFSATDLAKTPSLDLKDALSDLSPSFYVERNAAADQDTFARNTSLRGLGSGEVLTLLNGKRVHRSAILNKSGTQSANLGTFTINSLKGIEILRDGAAAQYGSDAVAGVINLTLDNAEGVSGQAGYSKYYAGDGALYQVSSKLGVAIGNKGFLTFTAGYSHQDPTARQLPHLAAAAMVADGARRGVDVSVDPATIFPFGISEISNVNATWNAALEIKENVEFYTFGNFANSVNIQPFNYRESPYCNKKPTDHPGLRDCSEIPELHYKNGSIGGPNSALKPTKLTLAVLEGLIGVEAAAEAAYLLADGPNATSTNGADPVGYDPKLAFPDGYIPFFHITGQDIGGYLGFRGELDNGLTWDVSGSAGSSTIKYENTNTQNASLGAPMAADGTIDYGAVQRDFYVGGLVNREESLGIDFTYKIASNAVEEINVAFGAEFRAEQYRSMIGEENSWKVGPLVDLSIGSNGFAGISPVGLFDVSRHNYAAYVDVDTQVTESFNVAVAARYENFSDFGDNFSWKISGRWQAVEDTLALRGAASTGFHAPTLGQLNTLTTSTAFVGGEENYRGLFPADHAISVLLGAQPLKAETAKNLSAGIVFTPGNNTNITIDFFQIKLKDRIRRSQRFKASNSAYAPAFQALIDSGFPGASALTDVRFFTNGIDTKTRGVEVVATHNIEFDSASLKLGFAYAHVTTEVTRFDPIVTDDRVNFNIEHYTVPHKATFSAAYSFDDFVVTSRARWSSTRQTDQGYKNDDGSNRIDENPGRVYFDLSVAYDINENYSLIVGADNIFNTFPESLPDLIEASNNRGRQYIFPGPDWQGGSYYMRVSAKF